MFKFGQNLKPSDKMKPEAGKSYKTRNGMIARIHYNSNEMNFPYSDRPFGGVIVSNGEIQKSAFFTVEGKFLGHKEHDLDLIEEI